MLLWVCCLFFGFCFFLCLLFILLCFEIFVLCFCVLSLVFVSLSLLCLLHLWRCFLYCVLLLIRSWLIHCSFLIIVLSCVEFLCLLYLFGLSSFFSIFFLVFCVLLVLLVFWFDCTRCCLVDFLTFTCAVWVNLTCKSVI